MRVYRKVTNCGPVPYPDRSGKFLTTEDGIGDGWAPFVALGYVYAVDLLDDGVVHVAPVVEEEVKEVVVPDPKPELDILDRPEEPEVTIHLGPKPQMGYGKRKKF